MKREDKRKKNKKIRESKYNRQYKYIKGEGIFEEKMGRKETKKIDEVQIRNYEMRERKYRKQDMQIVWNRERNMGAPCEKGIVTEEAVSGEGEILSEREIRN